MTIADDGTIAGNVDTAPVTGTKGRRWLRVLGFGD